MPVVITCYEIPRDATPPTASSDARRLLRAAAVPPSRFGYLELTEVAEPDAAVAAARRVANGPVAARSGSYTVFHANARAAAPFTTGDADSSIMFINCLECTAGEDDAFAVWQEISAYMVTKPGYRWHKLHRRTHPGAPFGFVNVVEWESPAAWQAAHDEGFRALASRPDLHFRATPTLCLPVDDDSHATASVIG